MSADQGILFMVDEMLPRRRVEAILGGRGHRLAFVDFGTKDPAIIVDADLKGAVIVTADAWFLKELIRDSSKRPRRFSRIGVVQVPGIWNEAERRLAWYLPIIETMCGLCTGESDARFGINLSTAEVRLWRPVPPSGSLPRVGTV